MAPTADFIASVAIPKEEVASIKGNASFAAKEAILKILRIFAVTEERFCGAMFAKLRVVEVSILDNPDEPSKREAQVVSELMVEESMLNPADNMHGGCAIFLIDQCSTLPIVGLLVENGADPRVTGVSQCINTVFHAPAFLGTNLKIVSTSVITDGSMPCSRAQIWDADKHRLLVSGVQTNMVPSSPKTRL